MRFEKITSNCLFSIQKERVLITNYSNLPDVVVFTQARISDHKHGEINYLINIKNEALQHNKSQNFYIHNEGTNRNSNKFDLEKY